MSCVRSRFVGLAQPVERQFVNPQQFQPLLEREFVPIELCERGKEPVLCSGLPHRIVRRETSAGGVSRSVPWA